MSIRDSSMLGTPDITSTQCSVVVSQWLTPQQKQVLQHLLQQAVDKKLPSWLLRVGNCVVKLWTTTQCTGYFIVCRPRKFIIIAIEMCRLMWLINSFWKDINMKRTLVAIVSARRNLQSLKSDLFTSTFAAFGSLDVILQHDVRFLKFLTHGIISWEYKITVFGSLVTF